MTERLQSEVTEQDIEAAYKMNTGLDSVKALLDDDSITPEAIIIAAKVTTSMPQIRIEGHEQPLGRSVNTKILDQLGRIVVDSR